MRGHPENHDGNNERRMETTDRGAEPEKKSRKPAALCAATPVPAALERRVTEGSSADRGLSVLWFAAGSLAAPINVMQLPPQMPKYNTKSNRLYLEAGPSTQGVSGAVSKAGPHSGVDSAAPAEKFCPPSAGDVHIALRGNRVHKISYVLPARPDPPKNEGDAGRAADAWVQLNEPKSEYVVQLKLAQEGTRPAWALARMLVYVPNAVALELCPPVPGGAPIGWRPGAPVTINAVLAI